MALLGFEGFDNFSTNGTLDLANLPFGATGAQNGAWNANGFSLLLKVAGLLGGFALRGGNAGQMILLNLFSSYATLITGFRYKVQNPLFTLVGDICRFSDSGTVQCGLSVNLQGKLIVWRGTNATVLATGTTVLTANGWYMIEIKATINNATGSIEVRLDGASEISVSGVDTQNSANASANTIQYNNTSVVSGDDSVALDDVYVLDTTGSAPYNDFLGVVRVETLYVTSNDSVAWTPLASTNASNVDELSMDSDTTYNSCSAAAKDTFNHGSLTNTPVNIYAVDVIAAVRKTDVTNQTYHTVLLSGTSTSNGTDINPPTPYAYARDTYLIDPNSSTSWTAAAVNATKIGYERT